MLKRLRRYAISLKVVGFEPLMRLLNFVNFPAALRRGVNSAPYRIEYQKQKFQGIEAAGGS
jgi:hypothetical protein